MLHTLLRWLAHLSEWRVLLCTQCQRAIEPARLGKHLCRAPHDGLHEKGQRAIVAHVQSLRLLSLSEVWPPRDGVPAVPGLRLYCG
jgi:hypothetical protein